MIYALMVCVFMSSSGESCTDVKLFPTADLCELDRRQRKPGRGETYKCEERKFP